MTLSSVGVHLTLCVHLYSVSNAWEFSHLSIGGKLCGVQFWSEFVNCLVIHNNVLMNLMCFWCAVPPYASRRRYRSSFSQYILGLSNMLFSMPWTIRSSYSEWVIVSSFVQSRWGLDHTWLLIWSKPYFCGVLASLPRYLRIPTYYVGKHTIIRMSDYYYVAWWHHIGLDSSSVLPSGFIQYTTLITASISHNWSGCKSVFSRFTRSIASGEVSRERFWRQNMMFHYGKTV